MNFMALTQQPCLLAVALLLLSLVSCTANQTPNVKVQFVDQHVGWIIGPRLLQTTDGGKTWSVLRQDGLGTIQAEEIFQGRQWIQFTSPEVGWSAGGSGVAKTTDGGRSWSSAIVTDGLDQSLDSLFFISPQEGWVVGNDIYHTSDGGQKWEKLSLSPKGDVQRQRRMKVAPDYANHMPALWFIDSKNGLMARLDGEVYRTNDGGRTWNIIWTVDKSITDIFFLDDQNGWLVGSDGFVAKTGNGGQTWSSVATPIDANLTSVFFINKLQGCVVGYGGTILITRDGGVTWKTASINGLSTPSPLASVSFADEQRGWAVGGNNVPLEPSLTSPSNVILMTADGGQTWRAIQP